MHLNMHMHAHACGQSPYEYLEVSGLSVGSRKSSSSLSPEALCRLGGGGGGGEEGREEEMGEEEERGRDETIIALHTV